MENLHVFTGIDISNADRLGVSCRLKLAKISLTLTVTQILTIAITKNITNLRETVSDPDN